MEQWVDAHENDGERGAVEDLGDEDGAEAGEEMGVAGLKDRGNRGVNLRS